MGAFICQISERDWKVSRSIGAYGNRERKPDGSGDLRFMDKMSIIRDLISIKPNDLVFFHVVKKYDSSESSIHGIYKARSQAYYDETKIWEHLETHTEFFPYRFLFEPLAQFLHLSNRDSYVFVSELYNLIEKKKIWSLATLENERNMERRAVRKISIDDAQEILKLILKNPKYSSSNPLVHNLINLPNKPIFLRAKIDRINSIENSIKALLMDELKNETEVSENLFGLVYDFMNETFVAQSTRKLFDLLVISRDYSVKDYFILEAKTNNYTIENLTQLFTYVDLFKQKDFILVGKNKVFGCALAQNFNANVIESVVQLKKILVFDDIKLIKYTPTADNKSASFSTLEIGDYEEDISFNSNIDNSLNLNIYDNQSLFKIDVEIFQYFQTKKVFFVNNNEENHLIKTLIIYKVEHLNIYCLKSALSILKDYTSKKCNYDYSLTQLIIEYKFLNKSVANCISTYNSLLYRPNIILKSIT